MVSRQIMSPALNIEEQIGNNTNNNNDKDELKLLG